MADHIPKDFTDWGGKWTCSESCNNRFRYCKYGRGGIFGTHSDAAYAPSASVQSKLTVNIYLNTISPEDGGQTSFIDSSDWDAPVVVRDVQPTAGTALVFDHNLSHRGTLSEAPVKYLLRTDVMYHKRPVVKYH